MTLPLPVHFQWVAVLLAAWVTRQEAALIAYYEAENRVLKEQLGGRRPKFTKRQRWLLAEKAHALGRRALGQIETIVTPETLLRWYRRLVAAKYTPKAPRRSGGRPEVWDEAEALVVRLARENRTWGYERLQGALSNLGHAVSSSSIARILERHGLPPAPERGRSLKWSTFLRSHAVAAADFFSVEVLTLRGLVRYQVFFVIEIATRKVHVAGIRPDPDGAWLTQLARNLTDPFDGFLKDMTHLVLDRDPLYCAAFCKVLEEAGVTIVRTPPRTPNMNAFAERCALDQGGVPQQADPAGRGSPAPRNPRVRRALPRRAKPPGTGNRLIAPAPGVGSREGEIVVDERLGGLLRHYRRRQAA
ncbi:MAG: hypothetical protein R3F62_03870 [Planctomycetota bacterium]